MLLKKFKILIFDLDDTLLDTSGLLIAPAARESCSAMIQAGLKTDLESCLRAREEILEQAPGQDILSSLIHRFQGDSETFKDIYDAGFKAFYERAVPENLAPFAECKPLLSRLMPRYQLFLVTSGAPNTQRDKVQKMNLEHYFKKIYYVNFAQKERKLQAFRDVLLITKVSAQEILSIGNRLDSEIADAKILGMKTCWVRRGEYAQMVPKRAEENPDFRISQLKELVEMCKL